MTKIHVKQQVRHEGDPNCKALATIGAVVATVPIVASTRNVGALSGPITFDEERYRLGESIFI